MQLLPSGAITHGSLPHGCGSQYEGGVESGGRLWGQVSNSKMHIHRMSLEVQILLWAAGLSTGIPFIHSFPSVYNMPGPRNEGINKAGFPP